MEWSNEMVLKFLDYYAEEPVIWNSLHPANRRRDEVPEAWKRIEQKMGGEFSVEQLKKKKDSLMASYRVVARRSKSAEGSEDGYRPIWFAYEKMASFLRGRKGRSKNQLKTEPSIDQSLQDSVANHASHDGSDECDDYIQEEVSDVFPQQVASGHMQVVEEVLHLTPRETEGRSSQKRKIWNESVDDNRVQMEHAYSNLHSKQKEHMDYCDKYGDIVASRLRQLDEWHRDSAINKIDNILYEEKCMYLKRFRSHSSGDNHLRE